MVAEPGPIGYKREPFCQRNEDFGRLSRFPEHIFVGGHFSENELVLFGGPGIIWRMKDPSIPIWRTKGHLVMKGLSKNVENHGF